MDPQTLHIIREAIIIIAGLIIRHFEKKKLLKNGKL